MKLPAHLCYVSDSEPGITRKGAGRGFAYYWPDQTLIRQAEVRERLQSLAVPPAYRDVWYSEKEHAHLQATGYDGRGRKQYRYHPDWSAWREAEKFSSLRAFGEVLPSLRNAVSRELGKTGLGKEKVVAAVVRLLDRTAARIGNEVYYQENGTSGLTTLRGKHVETEEGSLELNYLAKGGEEREFDLYQPRLVKLISQLQDLPGQRLFTYQGENGVHPVDSSDVNEWLRDRAKIELSAKDFRTWRASQLTLTYLRGQGPAATDREKLAQEKEALKKTSQELGHRPPVCRKHYVHPEILRCHREGCLHELFEERTATKKRAGLSEAEEDLLWFLSRL